MLPQQIGYNSKKMKTIDTDYRNLKLPINNHKNEKNKRDNIKKDFISNNRLQELKENDSANHTHHNYNNYCKKYSSNSNNINTINNCKKDKEKNYYNNTYENMDINEIRNQPPVSIPQYARSTKNNPYYNLNYRINYDLKRLSSQSNIFPTSFENNRILS